MPRKIRWLIFLGPILLYALFPLWQYFIFHVDSFRLASRTFLALLLYPFLLAVFLSPSVSSVLVRLHQFFLRRFCTPSPPATLPASIPASLEADRHYLRFLFVIVALASLVVETLDLFRCLHLTLISMAELFVEVPGRIVVSQYTKVAGLLCMMGYTILQSRKKKPPAPGSLPMQFPGPLPPEPALISTSGRPGFLKNQAKIRKIYKVILLGQLAVLGILVNLHFFVAHNYIIPSRKEEQEVLKNLSQYDRPHQLAICQAMNYHCPDLNHPKIREFYSSFPPEVRELIEHPESKTFMDKNRLAGNAYYNKPYLYIDLDWSKDREAIMSSYLNNSIFFIAIPGFLFWDILISLVIIRHQGLWGQPKKLPISMPEKVIS